MQFTVIAWLDTGRSTNPDPHEIWLHPTGSSSSRSPFQGSATPHQVILRLPATFLQPKRPSMEDSRSFAVGHSKNGQSSTDSRSATISCGPPIAGYGDSLTSVAAAADPLYAVSELLTFVAHSERQFLNFVAKQLTTYHNSVNYKDLESAQQDYGYIKALLDSHVQHLQRPIQFLRGQEWNQRQDVAGREPAGLMVDKSTVTIREDFDYLIRRAEALSKQCTDKIAASISRALMENSRNSIEQATAQKRLTLLAFLFLPASLTSSLFGMNFAELGNGSLPLWIFFAVLIPMLVLSLILGFWTVIWERCKQAGKRAKDHGRGG